MEKRSAVEESSTYLIFGASRIRGPFRNEDVASMLGDALIGRLDLSACGFVYTRNNGAEASP